MDSTKYCYNPAFDPSASCEWIKKTLPDHAPLWCSVDLRDGNQALITPLTIPEKLEYFAMLKKIGFKQIEVGYPSQTGEEFQFVRRLIETDVIPDDVTIQVISTLREGSIRQTLESLKGCKKAILHVFSTLSDSMLDIVLKKSRKQVMHEIVDRVLLTKNLVLASGINLSIQFTPEGFTNTDTDYALTVCNAVIDTLMPEFKGKIIVNLPATVENELPHVFASRVEYISKHLIHREQVVLSIHPHNDMGCAIGAGSLALLAGADRIEGTLFGNGERTGNVDLMTVALNLLTHGIDPGLDFSELPAIRETYERLTGLGVFPRHPYAGDLVFTALSASHQDAIAKGISEYRGKGRKEPFAGSGYAKHWHVPYLPIDPEDIGRTYESDIIRINSLSGKGGVSYILKTGFGFILPEKMKAVVAEAIKDVLGENRIELSGDRVFEIFENRFIHANPIFSVPECHFRQTDGIFADVTIRRDGTDCTILATGNGRLDATSNAIKQFFGIEYELSIYEEHALSHGSASAAAAYVGITAGGIMHWGVGTDSDIIKASIHALVVAVNSYLSGIEVIDPMEQRMISILNYIQNHYADISMDELSEEFHLTKPYLSKYIRQKTGETFGEIVQNIRMNKACDLLRETNLTVEAIAEKVGYPTIEHFNRLFKKRYQVTPVGYRNRR
ncbi:MAG: 2-isopropylmalate synthase [Lachnospiraceae bacterium]